MSVVLAVNAGSSSLKLALVEGEQQLTSAAAKLAEGSSVPELVEPLLREVTAQIGLDKVSAIGHRIVHGGALKHSVRFDAASEQALEAASALAPLHNPPALAVLRKLKSLLPNRPHVCVFDTTFFATLDESAWLLPVPYEWFSQWGIRRFGFHGISHEHMANRAMALCAARPLRVISLHLGSGCSATASIDGTAVATTMGYTPMDGLVMGTRSGSLDPGVLIALLKEKRVDLMALEDALLHRSGLKGISGVSGDFQAVQKAAAAGDNRSLLAIKIFGTSVRQQIGAYLAQLGGADALVFSGGIGEHSAALRAEVCRGLESLGVSIDERANTEARGECQISGPRARCTILVVPASEELSVARETNLVLG